MRRLLRGSSSRSSKDKQNEEAQRPKYNLPRIAKIRSCEWPSDNFLREAGIYEDFYSLIKNAGLTDFVRDQRPQYLLLTNTFVQNFYFFPKESPPSVEFHLYDVVKKMPLSEFCAICNIPPEGTLEEPPWNIFLSIFFSMKNSEIFSNFKQMWTNFNKTDSNYSYKCLESISSIRTT